MFNSNQNMYITPSYFEQLKRKLHYLSKQRADMGRDLQSVREPGRDADNTSYMELRGQSMELDSHMQAIQRTLKHATLIKKPKRKNLVEMGNMVELHSDSEVRQYMLVGSLEADPNQYKISDVSPLGRQLLGKRVGDTVEIGNGTKVTFTIRGIR